MQRFTTSTPFMAVSVSTMNRFRDSVERSRTAMKSERGLTTTEVAVLTFILVSIAAAIGVLLYNYARGEVGALDEIDIDPTIASDT